MIEERSLSRRKSALLGTVRLAGAASLVLAALVCFPSTVRAQDGVPVLSGAEEIDLAGRVQVQAITSSCSGEAPDAGSACVERVPGFDLFARRVRMALEVKVNDWISGEIQPDFGAVSGAELKNAYGRLTFGPAAKLQVGQFKKPFDGFHLTSSTQILTIERDLDVPGVPGPRALSTAELTTRNRISSYDLGVMLFGELAEGVDYWAGMFNGRDPGANGDVNTDKQFVGRLRYSTTAGELPVSVAVAGALTDLPYTGAGGRLGGQTYGDVEVFAEVGDFEGGPHLQAGYVFGENALETPEGGAPNPPAADLATMNTWQAIGSWKLDVEDAEYVEAVEPVFRVTRSEPNTDVADDEVWGFTPGLQLFFDGRNKIALNWDVVTFAGDAPSASSFKAQYQLHF